jgi:hypothetical protein
MGNENMKYFPPRIHSQVLLQCGHWVNVRIPPHPRAKLGCTSGLGCGYNFNWEKYRDENGKVTANRWMEGKKK